MDTISRILGLVTDLHRFSLNISVLHLTRIGCRMHSKSIACSLPAFFLNSQGAWFKFQKFLHVHAHIENPCWFWEKSQFVSDSQQATTWGWISVKIEHLQHSGMTLAVRDLHITFECTGPTVGLNSKSKKDSRQVGRTRFCLFFLLQYFFS